MEKSQKENNQGSILDILATILDIQELDMQMIQLMGLKRERQKEMDNINAIKRDLTTQVDQKAEEIKELKVGIRLGESELKEIQDKIKLLEEKQTSIKKVDEFNALSQEMSQIDRMRSGKELNMSDLYDKQALEEDTLKNYKESLDSTTESSKILEHEIHERLLKINEEGRVLKEKRDQLVKKAYPEVFAVYERLLQNKKDRVVVPIENRTCSGCHIQLTAQDENLVRKAERLVFCEHCSRILYWVAGEEVEAAGAIPRPRRRRKQASKT